MPLFAKELDTIERIQLTVSYLIRVALVVAIGEALFIKDWVTLFAAALVLLLTFIPAFIERNLRIHLPVGLEFVTVVFIYASIFLGIVRHYYVQVWWWDILAHAMLGIVLGFAGFLILFILYHHNKIKASPLIIVTFSFCFAMAIGGIVEIVEFGTDSIFGTNMQKSGLVDTMWDLITDAGGALLASLAGYFYIKKGKGGIIGRIIKKFLSKNPQFS